MNRLVYPYLIFVIVFALFAQHLCDLNATLDEEGFQLRAKPKFVLTAEQGFRQRFFARFKFPGPRLPEKVLYLSIKADYIWKYANR